MIWSSVVYYISLVFCLTTGIHWVWKNKEAIWGDVVLVAIISVLPVVNTIFMTWDILAEVEQLLEKYLNKQIRK